MDRTGPDADTLAAVAQVIRVWSPAGAAAGERQPWRRPRVEHGQEPARRVSLPLCHGPESFTAGMSAACTVGETRERLLSRVRLRHAVSRPESFRGGFAPSAPCHRMTWLSRAESSAVYVVVGSFGRQRTGSGTPPSRVCSVHMRGNGSPQDAHPELRKRRSSRASTVLLRSNVQPSAGPLTGRRRGPNLTAHRRSPRSGRAPDQPDPVAEGATPPRNLSGIPTARAGNSGKQAPTRLADGASRAQRGEALRLMTEGEAHSAARAPVRARSSRSP